VTPCALPHLGEPPAQFPPVPGSGQLVAVWGPAGAPGRTTVAVGLADEAARLGVPTLLVDADTYGGVVAQALGLLDESPGLAAAARLDNQGSLDVPALAGIARGLTPHLRVLTGISRADRWPELRADSVRGVLDRARSLAALTVVDCGFCLEQDEELAYDTMAPRRNGTTLAVLEAADVVLAVGSADPIGIQRLVRGLSELAEAVPDQVPRVVVNRLRSGVVPGDPAREVAAALRRFAGVQRVETLPYDQAALDRALASGCTLAETVPNSPLRQALTNLASDLVGVPPPPPTRRGWRR
jgi:MinD-like ATPase involved in chromosome partitioning or flagellar assembly